MDMKILFHQHYMQYYLMYFRKQTLHQSQLTFQLLPIFRKSERSYLNNNVRINLNKICRIFTESCNTEDLQLRYPFIKIVQSQEKLGATSRFNFCWSRRPTAKLVFRLKYYLSNYFEMFANSFNIFSKNTKNLYFRFCHHVGMFSLVYKNNLIKIPSFGREQMH